MHRHLDGDDRLVSLAFANCMLFIGYLLWDMYHMTLSKNHAALYRFDLLVHHVVVMTCYLFLSLLVPLLGTRLLIAEYLSLMNARLHGSYLRQYRIFVLVAIRIPMWIYFIFHYNPRYLSQYVSHDNTLTTQMVTYASYLFGLGYDSSLLLRAFSPVHHQAVFED